MRQTKQRRNQIWRTIIAILFFGTIIGQQAASVYAASDSYSWKKIESSAPKLPGAIGTAGWLSVASSADGSKIIAAQNGSIYNSIDGGVHWTAFDSLGAGWKSLAMSSDGSVIAALGGTIGSGAAHYSDLIVSHDGGATWIDFAKFGWTNNSKAISMSSNGQIIVVSTAGTVSCTSYGTGSYGCGGSSAGSGSISVSTDSGTTWTKNTSLGTGNWAATAMSSDGNDIIVSSHAAGGAAFVSSDQGSTWNQITTLGTAASGWQSVVMSSDGQTLLATQDGGLCTSTTSTIYKSTDGGGTWNTVTSPISSLTLNVGLSGDGNVMAVGGYNRCSYSAQPLAISTDGGASWHQSTSTTGTWSAFSLTPDGSTIVAAQAADASNTYNSGSIYLSNDTGASWHQATSTNLYPPYQANWGSVAMSGDGTRIIAAQNRSASGSYSNPQGLVLLSSDGGVSWHTISALGTARWQSVTISADGTRMMAVSDKVYISSDSGVTWTTVASLGTNGHWRAGAISGNGSTLALTQFANASGDYSAGGVYTSTDGGVTWAKTSTASMGGDWSNVAISADGSKILAAQWSDNAGNAGGAYLSQDSGRTWQKLSVPVDGPWIPVAMSANGSTLILGQDCNDTNCSEPGVMYISRDGGASWTKANTDIGEWDSINVSADGTKIIANASSFGTNWDAGGTLVSSDSGKTWSVLAPPLGQDGTLNTFALSADGTKIIAGQYYNETSAPGYLYLGTTDSQPAVTSTTVTSSTVSGTATPGSRIQIYFARFNRTFYTTSDGMGRFSFATPSSIMLQPSDTVRVTAISATGTSSPVVVTSLAQSHELANTGENWWYPAFLALSGIVIGCILLSKSVLRSTRRH